VDGATLQQWVLHRQGLLLLREHHEIARQHATAGRRTATRSEHQLSSSEVVVALERSPLAVDLHRHHHRDPHSQHRDHHEHWPCPSAEEPTSQLALGTSEVRVATGDAAAVAAAAAAAPMAWALLSSQRLQWQGARMRAARCWSLTPQLPMPPLLGADEKTKT